MTVPQDPPPSGEDRSDGDGAARRATFASAPSAHRRLHRMRHRHLFGILLLALAVLSAILVLAIVLAQPAPPKPCRQLFECGGPVAGQAVRVGRLYKSSEFGFTLEYERAQTSGASPSKNGVVFDFAVNDKLEQGQVEIVGFRVHGQSASNVVSELKSQVAPNAVSEYQVPHPYVGYVPASGEAYDVEQTGASNSGGLERLIILAAVKGNLAIGVIDLGPYWDFSNSNKAETKLNDHPSPADQFAALFADPIVNSVTWPK